jgi:hypothetical protein
MRLERGCSLRMEKSSRLWSKSTSWWVSCLTWRRGQMRNSEERHSLGRVALPMSYKCWMCTSALEQCSFPIVSPATTSSGRPPDRPSARAPTPPPVTPTKPRSRPMRPPNPPGTQQLRFHIDGDGFDDDSAVLTHITRIHRDRSVGMVGLYGGSTRGRPKARDFVADPRADHVILAARGVWVSRADRSRRFVAAAGLRHKRSGATPVGPAHQEMAS